MAELLVMQVDFTSPDPSVSPTLPRRGDVVVVCPDGWRWSVAEATDPHWRVLKFPLVSLSEARMYETPGAVSPTSGLLPTNRAFGLDLDHALFTQDFSTVTSLDPAKVARTPSPDPSHIGTDPTVIG